MNFPPSPLKTLELLTKSPKQRDLWAVLRAFGANRHDFARKPTSFAAERRTESCDGAMTTPCAFPVWRLYEIIVRQKREILCKTEAKGTKGPMGLTSVTYGEMGGILVAEGG